MPRAFSRRYAVCAPSRRLHKSIAAKQKPTPSAVEPSSDSTPTDNFRLANTEILRVLSRTDVGVADCEIGHLLALFLFARISGSKKVANCLNYPSMSCRRASTSTVKL